MLTVIVLLLRLTCAFSWAQAETPPGPTPPTQNKPSAAPVPTVQKPALPAPISAASIAYEVEAASLRLRRIKIDLDTAGKSSAIQEQLAVLTTSLKRIRPELESGNILQQEELFDSQQELARFSLRLKQLQDELVPKSWVLEQRREELRRMELLWNVTYQSLSVQEAPGSSRELVLATQKRIGEMITLIQTYRPVLLTIQDQISEPRIAVQLLLTLTNEAIEKSKRRLFILDSEPLWKAVRSVEVGTSVAESIRHSYLSRLLPLFDYMKETKWRILLHLLVSSLLVWLLAIVSRGSRKWLKQTGEKRELGKVLSHPMEAGLVISLLLSFTIYPNAPLALYRISLLLMVIPLARVVSGALYRDERAILYFLTGLFVLWRLDVLFSSANLVFRIYILITACLGLFGALWGARVGRVASRSGIGHWRRARLHLLRIGALIMLGSLIANVTGNVTLAALLTGATISSAYGAAAIFASVLILESFILPLLQSPLAQRSLAVREQSEQFRRRFSLLIRFGALIAWIWSTLLMFSVSEPVWEWLSSVLFQKHSFGQITFSLGGILSFAATIFVSVWAARLTAFVAEKDILSRMKLPQGIPSTISMLVRDSVLAFGIILALAGAGVQWSQIVLVASAIGVGVGLGLQGLVSSFIAGLILIVERQLRVGDTVAIANVDGVVSRIGMRSSTIQAFDRSEVICPNNRLISEDLINWTLSNQRRRIEMEFGVPHGADPDVVLAVLKRVAGDHPRVLQNPNLTALFKGFGESSLTFALRFFTLQNGWTEVRSEVGIQINNALREVGIEIALPQRDIRIMREPAPAQMNPQEPDRSGAGILSKP